MGHWFHLGASTLMVNQWGPDFIWEHLPWWLINGTLISFGSIYPDGYNQWGPYLIWEHLPWWSWWLIKTLISFGSIYPGTRFHLGAPNLMVTKGWSYLPSLLRTFSCWFEHPYRNQHIKQINNLRIRETWKHQDTQWQKYCRPVLSNVPRPGGDVQHST